MSGQRAPNHTPFLRSWPVLAAVIGLGAVTIGIWVYPWLFGRPPETDERGIVAGKQAVPGAAHEAAPPGEPPQETDSNIKLSPVLYLEAAGPPPEYLGPAAAERPVLLRELIRQALLIAARDEVGLTTRDANLGEGAGPNVPSENRVQLAPVFPIGKPVRVSVERTRDGKRGKLWAGNGPAHGHHDDRYAKNLEYAEGLSRTHFVTALKAGGFQARKPLPKSAARVPEKIETLLDELTFTSQFEAVRGLHALVRTEGESPWLVGALVRGYANLGVLTECHMASSADVFRARALLYAQRLVSATPDSAWAYRHRAYAEALAGLHKMALDDLQRAPEERAPEERAPAWLPLIDALCRFDTARLEAAGRGAKHKQLAQLLRFLTVEHPDSVFLTMKAARETLQDNPTCSRVYDSIADLGGVSNRHVTTLAGLTAFSNYMPKQLRALADLPEEAAKLLDAKAPEAEVWRALAKSGEADDASELSWSVVAHFGQEARFAQLASRLFFMRYMWSVDVTDFLQTFRPLVADHPCVGYIDAFALDYQRERERCVKLFESLPWHDVDYRHHDFLDLSDSLDWKLRTANRNRAYQQHDRVYGDMLARMRYERELSADIATAAELLRFSPYAPAARRYLVTDRRHAKDVQTWEKECQHPVLWRAFAQRYAHLKQWGDAERCLERCVALSPDVEAYREFAEVCRRSGDTERWRRTLETSLEHDSGGLEEARVRVDLAEHYERQNDFKRALPLAEDAAETWAGWALRCASRCRESVGDWKKAEQWLRRLSERYPDNAHDWYFFCQRTGKGDAAAARRLFERWLARVRGRESPSDLAVLGVEAILAGRPEEAPGSFEKAFTRQGFEWCALLAVVGYDQTGDAASRDRVLAKFPAKTPYGDLVKVFGETFAKDGKALPEPNDLDKAMETIPAEARDTARYYVGRLLDNRGDTKAAIEAYERCLRAKGPQNEFLLVLASARLRQLNVDPYPAVATKE